MVKRSTAALPGFDDEDFTSYEIDEIELDRELSARSFHDYVQVAWPLVEPAREFVDNWHVQAICEHLEAVVAGEINRLVINVPPGSMKSLSCCVFFPSWTWAARAANRKFIYSSYSDTISRRDSVRTRRIIESEWYRQRWGNKVVPNKDEWSSRKFSNTQSGFRMMTTISGGVTGEHADIQVVDDPIKPLEVTGTMKVTASTLEKVVEWWDGTMASRLVDFEKSARIIIMQRLHQGDLAGHVLRAGGYEHLCLPMEFVPERKCHTSIGFEDPRTSPGELLWPSRVPANAVANLKHELGARGAAAQLQQEPSPAAGAIFMRNQVQHYKTAPRFDQMIQSWDCTFKESGSSFVVGQVWGVKDAEFYLVDQIRERLSFSGTCDAIRQLSAKYPRAVAKLVEDKANGPAVADALKKELSGIKLVDPQGGKEARANAVEPLWEAMNVWLPDPAKAPWVLDFIEELVAFPASVNDDQVDAMSQALTYLRRRNMNKFRQAMQNADSVGRRLQR